MTCPGRTSSSSQHNNRSWLAIIVLPASRQIVAGFPCLPSVARHRPPRIAALSSQYYDRSWLDVLFLPALWQTQEMDAVLVSHRLLFVSVFCSISFHFIPFTVPLNFHYFHLIKLHRFLMVPLNSPPRIDSLWHRSLITACDLLLLPPDSLDALAH